jgi:hypothetical protein
VILIPNRNNPNSDNGELAFCPLFETIVGYTVTP